MRPRKTILCVDDNEQSLSIRRFILETKGYRVTAINDSAQALALFSSDLHGFDLVVSDLIMPFMDGNEMVRRMKELAPDVPMLIFSASIGTYASANRADAFIPKGLFTIEYMLERIRIMISRKRGPKKASPVIVPGRVIA